VLSQESTDAKRQKATKTATPPPTPGAFHQRFACFLPLYNSLCTIIAAFMCWMDCMDGWMGCSVLHEEQVVGEANFEVRGNAAAGVAMSMASPSLLATSSMDPSLMSMASSSSSMFGDDSRHDSDTNAAMAAAHAAAIRAAMRGSVSIDTPPLGTTAAAAATAAIMTPHEPATTPSVNAAATIPSPAISSSPSSSSSSSSSSGLRRRSVESKGESAYRPQGGVTPPLQVVPADVTISASRNSDTPGDKFTVYHLFQPHVPPYVLRHNGCILCVDICYFSEMGSYQ
jgi:hypothetical protein